MQRSLLATAVGAAVMLAPTAASGAVHTVAPGETLSGIAAANGLSPAAVAAANGLSPRAFVIAGHTLTIPAAGAVGSSTSSASGGGHLVVPGETLSGIAAANGLSSAALAAANGLSPTSFVIAGTRLRIPGPGAATVTATAPAAASGSSSGGHLVQPGETLSGIAAANGLSLSSLASANGLSTTSFAIAGTRLRIPARTGATTAGSGAPEPMGGYIIRPGDTLSSLASRSGVTVGAIAYMNGLAADARLIAGRSLKLPTGSPVLTGAAPASSAAPAAPSAGPQPTQARMSSSQIGAIAAQNGVPASLAAAIAWQESGFNNAMVSSTSARGVMQVMPGTWDWVQNNLTPSHRLNPFSAEDNVRAGTLYLGHLLRETGGDPALAAAGYYQGLASVRSSGMLPETRRYVANVLALRSRFGG